jgi:hypothetical protein
VRRAVALLALASALALQGCAGELATPGEPLRLLAAALPAAFEDVPYEAALRPTGGLRPYGFEVVDGELPPGLRLEGGRLLGTPTRQGRFAFTVEVRDANLSRTVQRLELSVRPLPEPVVTVDVPPTDVQRATELRLRLESGLGWRGAEVLITWDEEAFELRSDSVRPANRDVIAIWEAGPGQLRVDLAVIGEPLARAADLLRFTLVPVTPGRLGLSLTVASQAAGGRTLVTRRVGMPVAGPAPEPGIAGQETTGPDAPALHPEDEADPWEPPDDQAPDDETEDDG